MCFTNLLIYNRKELFSLFSLCSVQLLLGTAESAGNYSEDVLKGALAGVVGLYALNIFKIIVGVIGLVLSNKKSALTVALGFLLFIAQLAAFFQSGNGIAEIVINIILRRDRDQHHSACNPILLSA